MPRAHRRFAPKTWKRDACVYNKHILHQLGGHPIAQVDAEVLVEWQERLEDAGVGDPTLIKAMTILSSIFREAARRPRATGVRLNPVALLDEPSARRRRPRVWGPVVVERVRYQLLVGSTRIGLNKRLAALRDSLLVGFMAMTGCRPGEALALRWCDLDDAQVRLERALSETEIRDRTKTGADRIAPLLAPLAAGLAALRKLVGGGAEDFVFSPPRVGHWVETGWRNYRSRHFVPALERVEAEWEGWLDSLLDPSPVRESVAGLSETRPYDLGRHTHSALMLASGMSLQRLAAIQGHSIRVLDETNSEQLTEYEQRSARIDPIAEIAAARQLVWGDRDAAHGSLIPSGNALQLRGKIAADDGDVEEHASRHPTGRILAASAISVPWRAFVDSTHHLALAL